MSERKTAEERTESLVAAAERILERSQRITVSEIAREAGIASGTFYLYFPSKAHLEATLIERFSQGLVKRAEAEMAGEGDLLARLEATIEGIVTYALEHVSVLRLQASHRPTAATRELIARGGDRVSALLARALAEGVDAGDFTVEDPAMAALLLYHGIDGILRDSVGLERELDPKRLIRGAQAMLSAAADGARSTVTA